MSPKSVCFVATELRPFTHGGIGVIYANILEEFASPGLEMIFLYVGREPINREHFEFCYPNVRLVVAEHEASLSPRYEQIPGWAFSTGEWHRRSFISMLAIEALIEQGVQLDWIEFQDYGGLAAVTQAERVVNPSFRHLRISVRVHGMELTLRGLEPRVGQLEHLWTMDLERLAILQADLVVFHVEGVRRYVKDALVSEGVHETQHWILETPPILGSRFRQLTQSRAGSVPQHQRNILFASKIQEVKRPEVFLRGCAEFLSASDSPLVGDAIFLTDCDQESWEYLTSLLPTGQKNRFRLVPLGDTEDRIRALTDSVVVVPGPYESLCLLAFEAAACGATLVLNANNPAFGDNSFWVDGVNAIKFDGTSQGLARALDMVFTGQAPPVRRYLPPPPDPPYWLDAGGRAAPGSTGSPGSVGIVVTNFNLGEYVGSAVRSVVTGTRPPDRLIVVDDASYAPGERALIEAAISSAKEMGVDASAVYLTANRGLAAARNEALGQLDTDYVLFLDADDLLAPGFIERAGAALDDNPEMDVIVPQVAFFWDESTAFELPSRDYAVFLGDSHLGSLVANRISSATCLARTSAIKRHRFSEEMSAYEDWELWVRMRLSGSRFVPDYRVGLWYRQRERSMAATARTGIGHVVNLDRLRSRAQAAGALVEPIVLTDALAQKPPEIPSAEVLAAHGLVSHSESMAMRAEIERLTAVEEEFRTILKRKAVTLAMKIADSRHRFRNQNRREVRDGLSDGPNS